MLDGVRKRPGMYIGGVDSAALSHLLMEVVSNVIDLHLRREATELHVDVGPDSWVNVRDDGPGIRVDDLESIFTSLHDSATRDGHVPHVHVGGHMRGVGLAVVSALSTRLEVETTCDGTRWGQAFERGVRARELRSLGPSTAEGTEIRFHPDPEIFPSIAFDAGAIEARLQQLAWLNPLLRMFFQGRRLMARGGLRGWAETLVAPPIFSSCQTTNGVFVDLAFGWSDSLNMQVRSFVNMHETVSGTHVDGLRVGLADCARQLGATIDEGALTRGLVGFVHVGLWGPEFAGPTREHLKSPIAGDAVRQLLTEDRALRAFLMSRLGVAQAPTSSSNS